MIELKAQLRARIERETRRFNGTQRDIAWVMREAHAIKRAVGAIEPRLPVPFGLCMRMAWARARGAVTVLPPRNARNSVRQRNVRPKPAIGSNKRTGLRSNHGKSGFGSTNIMRSGELEHRDATVPCTSVPREDIKRWRAA